ncbi:hypothetical protein SLEP1_g52111 [Rubroshorea leprosula]|uniref:Uncharacterized protein n=1 Tax=Rubroshorea leprosula TaxID=152421 RepID=A0AAV5M5C3_9ROSI|nr:hypothetical protein SLEP1_g52111 [Rubroshorea leprosula]
MQYGYIQNEKKKTEGRNPDLGSTRNPDLGRGTQEPKSGFHAGNPEAGFRDDEGEGKKMVIGFRDDEGEGKKMVIGFRDDEGEGKKMVIS